MFTSYVRHVMEHLAHYEVIKDAKPHYGSIEGFEGVWAQGQTREECERELQEVLEEWLLLKIRKGGFVPTTANYDFNALLSA